MTDLDYLSARLDEFKHRYPKFVAAVPRLIAALANAVNVPVVNDHATYLVLGLSKLSIDRFEDIFILCSQRRGEGAMPLVRAMFEGLVNASYIRAHPDTADDFIRYLFSYIKKVQTQAEQLNGRIPTPAEKQRIDDALNSLPAPTSKIPPKNDWTPVNLVDRAKAVGLGQHVVVAYYRPMEISHPSMLHLYSQLKQVEGTRFVFGASDEFAQEKVKEALMISHRLAIDILILLHETFGNDELKPIIGDCLSDCSETWKLV